MKIAHRDIKAENIMLDRYRNIRVIDFGFSKGINSESLLTTACGSAAYIAPEVFTQETYTEKADIWSLGVVLFALNANHLPFDSSNAKKVRHMIMHMEPEYPSTFSPALVDLLKKMLLKDPEKRITIDEIVNHQWMLVPSPNGLMRYSLTYTKDHVLNYKNMDEGILNYMEFVGVDTKNLAEKLKTNVRDHVTSSYRALFRQKHAQMLSNYYTAALVPIQPNIPKTGPNITVIKLPTKLSNDNLPSANSLFDSPINSPTCSPPLSPINYGLLRSPQTKRTLQLASTHQQQFQIMQQQNQQQQQQRQQFRQPTMASSFLKIPQCLNRNQVSIKHNQESFSDDESMPSTMRLKPGVLIASPLRNTRYSTNRVLNSFYGPK
ncbi:CAMK family protein kinase [Tritrichomonas foetus]|uniref:CAMK family protein kinase n=1 Tax=Tritrichomonas foetus TaxID=1144522 RepID=A0A1J4KNV7_9EUKA|nr:CAMK family protein kinase [Tritrichomonas foetus]|eukprot:OHT12915.1 CAMK family protein kinase [Tritrichomonas foetus]